MKIECKASSSLSIDCMLHSAQRQSRSAVSLSTAQSAFRRYSYYRTNISDNIARLS